MGLTDSVVQQLRDRAKTLTALADQLRNGECLQSATVTAADPAVWSGAPQRVFSGWLSALDSWVRNQLGGAVLTMAESIELHARILDDAQRQVTAGIPGVVTPAPPRPLGTDPGRAPEFAMQIPRDPGPVSMAPDAMQNLVTRLGQARDGLLDIGHRVADALIPLVIPPGALGPPVVEIAAQLGPADHLPSDALVAAGCPTSWTSLGQQLDRALQDVAERARAWARAEEADSAGLGSGLFAGLDLAFGRAVAVAPVRSETDRLANEQGTADAERFAALVWTKKHRCPKFDDVARMLEDVKEKSARNPAYAEGFTAAMGHKQFEEFGINYGNGFQNFLRTVEVCWTNQEKHLDDAPDRLIRPLGDVFSAATHDRDFDIALAEDLLKEGLGGWYVFHCGPLRTDVALLAADHFIDEKAWKNGRESAVIAEGLRLLTRNPEAAHLYALAHADLLSKGTNPDLFHDPQGGGIFPDASGSWDVGVAALAADVLRIGLIDYPAQLAATAPDLSGEAAAAAVDAAKAAARAMGDAIDALQKGVHVGPEGKLVLAEFLAGHIADVGTSLTARDRDPSNTNLVASREGLAGTFKEVMGEPAARKVLLAGANTAVAGWAAAFATLIGDSIEKAPGTTLHSTINEVGGLDVVRTGAEGLGTLYGDLADAILANVKDQREAAAEMVGILGFLASQGFSSLASLGGAAIGGGVGALAAQFAAGKLSEAADSLICQADSKLKAIDKDDTATLRAAFMTLIRQNFQDTMVVALWSDPRIRSRIMSGEPPHLPAGCPPPAATPDGQVIDPPLVGADGGLRIPSPEEQPAHKLFFDWLERGGGRELRAQANEALEESPILRQFESTVADHLFKRV